LEEKNTITATIVICFGGCFQGQLHFEVELSDTIDDAHPSLSLLLLLLTVAK